MTNRFLVNNKWGMSGSEKFNINYINNGFSLGEQLIAIVALATFSKVCCDFQLK